MTPPRRPNWTVTLRQRARARALRTNMTVAERIVWNAIRAHRLAGAGFRRQCPIGPYFVDFVSHARRLVIEIDGGQHFEPEGLVHDARRDTYLQAEGYRVLRFNNHDVMRNRSGVLAAIVGALGGESPLPDPPPQAGEGAATAGGGASRGGGAFVPGAQT